MTGRSTMHAEIKRQTTRLFVALEYGEQLARQCALQQADWMNDRRAQRFLAVQAAQEASHAKFYRRAANWLSPRHHIQVPASLQAYGLRLQRALQRNDLCESLTASQIVLEGFGEQVISRLNRSMDDHGIGFKRLRRILLRQEQSHYAFGLRTLQHQAEHSDVAATRLPELTADYLDQINTIINEMSDVFVSLDADPNEYYNDLYQNLPLWLQQGHA